MKKIILVIFLSLSALGTAQEEVFKEKEIITHRHEIRVDALEALVIPALDITYEYVVSRFSGVGVSVFTGFGDDDTDNYQSFAISPYYRQYFFSKEDFGAKGFFAEGLLQLGTGSDSEYYFDGQDGQYQEEDWTKLGIGFAVGQKWVSQNGFVLELNLGGGRYFGNDDIGPQGFIRFGAAIGYRF